MTETRMVWPDSPPPSPPPSAPPYTNARRSGLAAGLHTVRSPGAASSSSCSGYSSHFPLLSSWGHSRVRKAEPNVFSDGPRLDTCRAMRHQGILCSASPTGCSYGAQPSLPVHPTHRHLKEHSAAHVALAPHRALPPHCPPKEEPGRHRHTAGTAGSMQPRRVGGGRDCSPHPISTHPVTERGSSMTTRARATTGSRVGCSLILGTTKELGWGPSQSLSTPPSAAHVDRASSTARSVVCRVMPRVLRIR